MLFVENVEIPFEFGSIIAYLSGIATGFILAGLIYVLLMLLSINKSKKIIEASVNNITEEDVRIMISQAKDNYKLLKTSEAKEIKENAYKESVLTLVNNIASKCFPESKKPLQELSIDESLLLAKYVIQRIEEILDKKVVRIVKKLTVKQIVTLLTTKKKIDNNAIVKEAKKVSKIAKIGLTIVNTITKPFKLIGTGTKNLILNKIMLVTFDIIGEETYKIYTKQAMKSMSPEYQEFLKEVDEEIKEEIEA